MNKEEPGDRTCIDFFKKPSTSFHTVDIFFVVKLIPMEFGETFCHGR